MRLIRIWKVKFKAKGRKDMRKVKKNNKKNPLMYKVPTELLRKTEVGFYTHGVLRRAVYDSESWVLLLNERKKEVATATITTIFTLSMITGATVLSICILMLR